MPNPKPGWLLWKPKKQSLSRNWDVITIGSGLGALMAAAKLAKEGLRCLVLEQHYVAGGYAHHFPRKKKGALYLFDVALHQTGRLKAGQEMYEWFRDVGVIDKIEVVDNDIVYQSVFPEQGLDVCIPTDADAYRSLLKERFATESEGIDRFFEIMFAIPKELPFLRKAGKDPAINPFESAPNAMRYMSGTLKDVFDDTVRDPLLRALLAQLWSYLGLPPGEVSAIYFALMWRSMHTGAHYIRGGGQALSNALCEAIEERGGAVKLRTMVEKIMVRDGRAVGVRTAKGDEFFADSVVSNASTVATFNELLDPQYVSNTVRSQINSLPVSTSIIQAYVAIDGDAAALGLKEHELFLNRTVDQDAEWKRVQAGEYEGLSCLLANHGAVNRDACPPGKSVIEAAILGDGKYWIGLPQAEYDAKKAAVTEFLLDQIAQFIPDVRGRIEVIEVGTPKTMYEYSLNPNGAVYGHSCDAQNHTVFRPEQRTPIPGLYLAGAWTFPGAGFGGALTSGYVCAGLVLRDKSVDAKAVLA